MFTIVAGFTLAVVTLQGQKDIPPMGDKLAGQTVV